MVRRPCYLYNGNSCTGKRVSFYWNGSLYLIISWKMALISIHNHLLLSHIIIYSSHAWCKQNSKMIIVLPNWLKSQAEIVQEWSSLLADLLLTLATIDAWSQRAVELAVCCIILYSLLISHVWDLKLISWGYTSVFSETLLITHNELNFSKLGEFLLFFSFRSCVSSDDQCFLFVFILIIFFLFI